MMETYIWITACVLACFASFAFGAISMAINKNIEADMKERDKCPAPMEPNPPTRTTLYADRVITAATLIYCNYNESKIIRPNMPIKPIKPIKERQAQALHEALNLIGSAYNYFDILDEEQVGTRKPVSKKSNNDIDFNIN